eukprot:4934764-Amphidinium_carterae.1
MWKSSNVSALRLRLTMSVTGQSVKKFSVCFGICDFVVGHVLRMPDHGGVFASIRETAIVGQGIHREGVGFIRFVLHPGCHHLLRCRNCSDVHARQAVRVPLTPRRICQGETRAPPQRFAPACEPCTLTTLRRKLTQAPSHQTAR